MSIAIKESYFLANFNNPNNPDHGFTHNGPNDDHPGYYTKTIDEDHADWASMQINWDDVNDNIEMSYSIIPDPDGYSIGGGNFIK